MKRKSTVKSKSHNMTVTVTIEIVSVGRLRRDEIAHADDVLTSEIMDAVSRVPYGHTALRKIKVTP